MTQGPLAGLVRRGTPEDAPRWDEAASSAGVSGEGLSPDIDPLTFSVLMNRYYAVVWEMTLAYENAAWSTIISLARDFSCSLMDAPGRLVAMRDGCPLHITSQHVIVSEMQRAFEGDINEGDIIVCNHAHSGNSHIGDLVMITPVFWDGELIFWAAAKGHQADVGAPIPTSMPHTATDVWTEGIQIPPLRIYEAGEPRDDALRLYIENVRYPELLYGDLLAQRGCVQVGKRRILDTIAEYGIDTIRRYTEEMQDYGSRRAAAEIAEWPDGRYIGESWLDSDGSGTTDILIHAEVTIAGDSVHVDYSGSAPQVKGAVNSSYANTIGAGALPVTLCLAPDIPRNQGCLDRTTVDVGPKGLVTNCEWPGACALDTGLTGDVMQEAVWKALAQAIPDKVIAGVAKASGVAMSSGVDHRDGRTGEPWSLGLMNSGGGGGAGPGHDGWHQWIAYGGYGALRMVPIELAELLYPVYFECCEMHPMSGGAGQWNGGPGVHCVLRPLGDHVVDHWVYGEGAWNPPHGVSGGDHGIGGGHYLLAENGEGRTFYSAKSHVVIRPGEAWVSVSSGGGGYGSPLDRDPARVLADVLDELVPLEAARDVYGVVINEDKTEVLLDETEALRAEKRVTAQVSPVVPITPHAGTWYDATMRPGEELIVDAP